MQARCRCRDRSLFPREYRLVTFLVVLAISSLHVGRKRKVTVLRFIHRLVEFYQTVSVVLEDLAHNASRFTNLNALAHAQLFSWLHHAAPEHRRKGVYPQ